MESSTKLFIKNNATPVKCVEIVVESIDITATMVYNNNATSSSTICFAVCIWSDAIEPWGVRGDVNLGCQIDVLTTFGANFVELIEIVKCKRR